MLGVLSLMLWALILVVCIKYLAFAVLLDDTPNAVQQTHYLRVHMAALRRKIERDPARSQWLTTEAGVGYRVREPSS